VDLAADELMEEATSPDLPQIDLHARAADKVHGA
jgi:hypothetical protein